MSDTHVVELTYWEKQQLVRFVSSEYMVYVNHYSKEGLFDNEVDQANRLGVLLGKLNARQDPYVPLPYLGILPSGRKSDGT